MGELTVDDKYLPNSVATIDAKEKIPFPLFVL